VNAPTSNIMSKIAMRLLNVECHLYTMITCMVCTQVLITCSEYLAVAGRAA